MVEINWIMELQVLATPEHDHEELPDTAKITQRLIRNKLLSADKAKMVWDAMVHRARYLRRNDNHSG